MKKYCTKCGHEFDAVGREVICPECKAHAAEDAKRAAVLRAKRASWTGESVPVRISGRASTVIRWFAESQTMTFAEALDTLIKTSEYFAAKGVMWDDVEPYKSHRRDKHTTETHDAQTAADKQDAPQDVQTPQGKPQAARVAKTTSKTTSKASASKTTSKTTSKASASKTTSKTTSKTSK